MGASSILFLLLVTVAAAGAQLLGELIINARFLAITFPYFGRASGDCEFYQSTAIAACTLSCLTLIAFIAAPGLYMFSWKSTSKLVALGALILDFDLVICSIVLFARAPGWEDGVPRALECDWTGDNENEWTKHWQKKLEGYGEKPADARRDRAYPWAAHLGMMVLSLWTLVLLVALFAWGIRKLGGIERLPASRIWAAPV
jgi:hypothetical protein